MKKIIILVVLCLSVAGMLYLTNEKTEMAENTSLIRFHVVANSDSYEDQQVKGKVRDAVLAELSPALAQCTDEEAANDYLAQHQEEIKAVAENVLAEEGYDYGAETILGDAEFPTKSYGGVTLSAGTYHAQRIIPGEGKGKNWWCVLFPPLCFVDITDDMAVAEIRTMDPKDNSGQNNSVIPTEGSLQKVEFRSKILEMLIQ